MPAAKHSNKKAAPKEVLNAVPSEVIQGKILLIRGHKVILDKDLARLYGVTTGNLNKAVRRNLERFPDDFMFRLSRQEANSLRFQFGSLNRGQHFKYFPFAFTEQGVAMLSSVLKSPRAIQVNIAIMRVFVQLKKMLISNSELARKIEDLERRWKDHDRKFVLVFEAIKQLLRDSQEPVKAKEPIGFHVRK